MFVYDRELNLEQGFAVSDQPRHSRLVGGVEVSLASGIELFRYLRFQPIVCHLCGCVADRWIAARQNRGRAKPVLNLYGVKRTKTKHGYAEHVVMMTRDHIIPKSEGGIDDVRNLRPACEFCNSKRGSKMTADEIAFMKAHPELICPERARKGAESRERQRLQELAAKEARLQRKNMSYIDTSPEAVQFTKDWWERTLKDEAALIRWLQKLRHTEFGGFEDYTGFAKRFETDERAKLQFKYIADDEHKHSVLIAELLKSRGYELDETPTPSLFWGTMNEHIVDLQTAAAVNYFGEALAAFRFEVLIAHEQTPQDIKDMLGIILPDEQFHREALMRMAGEETIARLAPIYNATVKALKGSK